MTTWAIGDVHACLDDLHRLLERIDFAAGRDHLWFVGDLVNRGPHSLATLRFVRDLGSSAISVLGNHDLHLLARAHGARDPRSKDRFDEVLAAPDRHELFDWLRARPLLHHDDRLGFTLVHAGLHPAWDLATARMLAGEVEAQLRAPDYAEVFTWMYGDEPARWSPDLGGKGRLRLAINTFTRMRYCHADGSLDFDQSGPPGSQPTDLTPWFDVAGRANRDLRIVFGHWSTLGYIRRNGVHALDSGCLWGGALTALNLDDGETVVQVDCAGAARPAGVSR
jgi:bis(5'-nucleosyl)-tetraphosphatase (symmetrical)